MDELRERIRRREAGFWNHFGQDERDGPRAQEDMYENGAGPRPMGTMCEDDEFVFRGANPRTGIVSPFVFGEGSANLWQGLAASRDMPERGETSGRSWREIGLGWGLMNHVPLSSSTQRIDDESSCTKPSKRLEHMETSGRVESRISHANEDKMQAYRSDLTDLCQSRAENHTAIRTPILSPSAQREPASPAVLPRDSQRIHRKKVGSGHVQNDGLTNAEPIKEIGQDSLPKASATDTSAYKRSTFGSFRAGKGHLNDPPHRMIQLDGNLRDRATNPATVIASGTSKTESAGSGKYFPRMQFLPPTHIGSLTASYRRPTQFLTMQPRDTEIRDDQRNEGGKSATCTSGQSWKSEQRPQVYRKFGTTSIPRVDFHDPDLEDERQTFLLLARQGSACVTHQDMRVYKAQPGSQNHKKFQECAMPRTIVKTQSEELVSKTKITNSRLGLLEHLALLSPMRSSADRVPLKVPCTSRPKKLHQQNHQPGIPSTVRRENWLHS